ALAVHLRREVAVVRRERHAAARPVRSAGRAGAGAAGALLAPRLRAAARDQAAALAAAGRRARVVQLGAHRLVDEVRLHLGAEDALLERDALRGTENLSPQGAARGAAIRTRGLCPCVRLNGPVGPFGSSPGG